MRGLLLVLVLIAALVTGCVDDATPDPVPPSTASQLAPPPRASGYPATTPQALAAVPDEPSTSFSWSGDGDIETWLTNDDVAAIFNDLSAQYLGTSLVGDVVSSRDDEGTGDVSGPRLSWSIQSPDSSDSGWALYVHDGEHVRPDLAEDLQPSPVLPDGTMYVTGGWGIYTFQAAGSDELICIAVTAPDALGTPPDEVTQRSIVFTAASRILDELGWTGAVLSDASPVHPGSEALTPRQAEMIDVLEGYLAAWKARDGDLAATYMTDDAVFEYHEQGDSYPVADGSLQARISAGPYDTMRFFEPTMVYGNRIALTGTVDAVGVRWMSIIRFTEDGDEVLIDKETVFYGP